MGMTSRSITKDTNGVYELHLHLDLIVLVISTAQADFYYKMVIHILKPSLKYFLSDEKRHRCSDSVGIIQRECIELIMVDFRGTR